MGQINNDKLFRSVRELIENARIQVVRNVNTTMLYTNYTIGQMIVEEEQKGLDRAGYAEMVVKDLSISLTATYGKGFSKRNLDYFKQFYLSYRERIVQTLFAQFEMNVQELPLTSILTVFAEQFKVGWSHYLLLIRSISPRNVFITNQRPRQLIGHSVNCNANMIHRYLNVWRSVGIRKP